MADCNGYISHRDNEYLTHYVRDIYPYKDAFVKYKFSDITISEGTIIEEVDGMQTDDYVKSLQNKKRLLLDTDLSKNFITNLFSIDSDTSSDNWTVDFRLEDGTVYTGELRKLNTAGNTVKSLSPYNYPNAIINK